MNKYQKALNELKNSDIRLLVFKNVSEEEQPTIFDLFHSEIFALQELIDKETPMKPTEIKGVKKPILDDEEKAYLKLVIKNCRDNVRYISKKLDDYWAEEYICISIDGASEAVSPRFIENTQFKKMVCDRKYTLEELGL